MGTRDGGGVWFGFRQSRYLRDSLKIEKTLFSSVSEPSQLYPREPL